MQRLTYIVRGLRFVLGSLIVTAVILSLLILGQLILFWDKRLGQRYGMPLLHFWGKTLIRLAGGKLRVVGLEKLSSEPIVVMPNHSSYLDIYALFGVLPRDIRFIMKWGLLFIPVIGLYLLWRGHYYLKRKNRRQAARLFRRVAEDMRAQAATPLIFPEGTRSPDGLLHDLHPGSFSLAVEADAWVQPIALLGFHDLLPKKAWFPRRPGEVQVIIGDPISTKGKDRKQVCKEVRAALIKLGVPAPSGT